MPNYYSIPAELTTIKPKELLLFDSVPEEKVIFLEPNEEKFFLDFPKSWSKTLDDTFGTIYNSATNNYTFSIISYDGENISSYCQNMIGLEFKTYLAGLLKKAKTLVLFIANGLKTSKYIICLP